MSFSVLAVGNGGIYNRFVIDQHLIGLLQIGNYGMKVLRLLLGTQIFKGVLVALGQRETVVAILYLHTVQVEFVVGTIIF